MPDHDKLLQRLLVTFKAEAQERIAAIGVNLTKMEQAAGDERKQLVETVFRDAHSLKAAAGVVRQKEMERICHAMESVLAVLKRDPAQEVGRLISPLQLGADNLDDLLKAIDKPEEGEPRTRALAVIDQLINTLNLMESPRAAAPAATPAAQAQPPSTALPPAVKASATAPIATPTTPSVLDETVRLSVARLDALLLQADEMRSEKIAARDLAARLTQALTDLSHWRQVQRKVARGGRGASEEIVLQARRRLDDFEKQVAEITRISIASAHALGAKVDRLQEDMRQILGMRCATLFEPLHRVVREIARSQGKDVFLGVSGEDLELDRRILEDLKDPLVHIVRNCVDHGIENPHDREAAGKPARATITISVTAREGSKAEFVITDDGRGISTKKLADAAKKMGLLSADEPMTDADLLPLIFQSGLSTSAVLTDLSGRGVGLAIVREKVERLGGSISVETDVGRRTTFRIVVPLTLTTYRGILIKAAERSFVIPTLSVDRVVGLGAKTTPANGDRATIDVDGAPVPLVSLQEILDLQAHSQESSAGEHAIALIVAAGRQRIALTVDALVGDQEILVKSMGKALARVRNVQGATVLPTGEIVPILNVQDMILTANKLPKQAAAKKVVRAPQAHKRILLAEDSITARGLLKSILEAAGYSVKAVADGVEAWTALKVDPFDLLVSDVEMPRMSGFDLTARVRADQALARLPVVLVTALASLEDRNRGVNAGANAYILKGEFEQNQLLDAVRRFA